MEEQKPRDTWLSISGVVALVIALGAIFYSMAPLKGTRPYIPEVREEISPKVRARLWQDPFCAVLDSGKAGGKENECLPVDVCFVDGARFKKGPMVDDIATRLEKGTVTVLSVMVFGSSYAEDVESRIRHRYAILSGLNRLGFAPEDPEHIKFLLIKKKRGKDNKAENIKSNNEFNENVNIRQLLISFIHKLGSIFNNQDYMKYTLQNILPFEWFYKKNDYVLILWINNDADAFRHQLLSLGCLFRYLRPDSFNNKLKFKVIGPAGSAHLIQMIEEIKWEYPNIKAGAKPGTNPLEGVEIYTATATAADSSLLQEATKIPLKTAYTNSKDEAGNIACLNIKDNFYNKLNIEFNRKICTDDQLAGALIAELDLRGVNLSKEKMGGRRDHIVLVAEWDTFYGRSLPQTFKNVLKEKLKKPGQEVDPDEWVHLFSYIRGLDGKVPGEQERDAKERSKNSRDRNEEENLQKLEEPTGKGQYDYVRRLAEEIYHLDQELRRNEQGSIKAIGVLGSDFYDKYLVLQALGQRFPNLLYFTTDMDARFLYSPYNKWTRNLVVASGFGLQLCKKLQGEVPPFRDNYQTSLFWTTLRAVGNNSEALKKVNFAKLEKSLKPRIFEIGYTRAIDLTQDPITPRAENTAETCLAELIYPSAYRPAIKPKMILGILSLTIILLIILYLSKGTYKDIINSLIRNWYFIILGLFVSLILLYYYNNKILLEVNEEPFSLTEGLSVWPTEILRLLAIGLAWIFFIASKKQLTKNQEEIEQEFLLSPKEPNNPASREPISLWNAGTSAWNMVKTYFEIARYDWGVKHRDRISMNELWAEYLHRSSHYRFWRQLFLMILIIWLVCWQIKPLYFPVRGNYSRQIDFVMLILTIFSFYWLTFYVFDVTRLCRRFVNLMVLRNKEHQAQWSRQSLGQFTQKVDRAEEGLKYLMFVRLIAKRTEAVGKLIFYPFIVLVISLVARSHYFDNWRAPMGLLAFIAGLALIYTWSCALTLRRQAERTRDYIIDHLSQKLIRVMADDPQQPRVAQLQFVLSEVKATQRGAFAPLLQQPIIRSLLVPFGGLGGLHLLDFLAKY